MIIPNKLKIGGHVYKVILVGDNDLDVGGEGAMCRKKGQITILKDNKISEQEATLIHEIIHVCNNELKEEIIESMAQQLYQVFSDNRMFR